MSRKFLQEKAVEATKQKEEERENLSPRNMKACHSVGTALLKSVAEIGTQSNDINIIPRSRAHYISPITSALPQPLPSILWTSTSRCPIKCHRKNKATRNIISRQCLKFFTDFETTCKASIDQSKEL
jgi:hypothetical protein